MNTQFPIWAKGRISPTSSSSSSVSMASIDGKHNTSPSNPAPSKSKGRVYLYFEEDQRYEPYDGQEEQKIQELLDQLKTAEEALVLIRTNEKMASPHDNSNQRVMDLKAEIAAMAGEIKDKDFVIAGYRSTVSRLDSKLLNLEQTISELSSKGSEKQEKPQTNSSDFRSQIESISAEFERKQAALIESHLEHQQVLKEEIRSLHGILNQKEKRIQELLSNDVTNDLKAAVQTRDTYIKELESEVSTFKKIASKLNLSLGYPEELKALRQANARLKQELEAAQDSLLHAQRPASDQPDGNYPVLTPHSFLNLEISSALEEEQAVVESLSQQLRELRDRLSGDLTVDERISKLASGHADLISSTADLHRQVAALRAGNCALQADMEHVRHLVATVAAVFECALHVAATTYSAAQIRRGLLRGAQGDPAAAAGAPDSAAAAAHIQRNLDLAKRLVSDLQSLQLRTALPYAAPGPADPDPDAPPPRATEHARALVAALRARVVQLEEEESELARAHAERDEGYALLSQSLLACRQELAAAEARARALEDSCAKQSAELDRAGGNAKSLLEALVTRDHLVAARDIDLSAVRAENAALRAEVEALAAKLATGTGGPMDGATVPAMSGAEGQRRASEVGVVQEQLLSALAAARELQRTVLGASGQSAVAAGLLPELDCSLMVEGGLLRVVDVMREAEAHVHDLRAQQARLEEELARRSARRSPARDVERTSVKDSDAAGATETTELLTSIKSFGSEGASVVYSLAANLSWQIMSIMEHLEDERSDFNDDLFSIEQLFLSREGEIKNLMSVMGAAHEDISLLHFRLQMDEKVIKENNDTIADLQDQLSRIRGSEGKGDSDCAFDSQVLELKSQVQNLAAKLTLLSELAENDQREFEQDKARLESQISDMTIKCRAAEELIADLRREKETNAHDILGRTADNDMLRHKITGQQFRLHHQAELPNAVVDPGLENMLTGKAFPESAQEHLIASMVTQHEAQQKEIMRLTAELKRIASHVAEFNVIASPEKIPALSPRGHPSLMVGDRMFYTVANVGNLRMDDSRSEIQHQSHLDSETNIHESQSDQSQDV